MQNRICLLIIMLILSTQYCSAQLTRYSSMTPEQMLEAIAPPPLSAASILRSHGNQELATILERTNALSTVIILELTPSQLFRISRILEALVLVRVQFSQKMTNIPTAEIAREVKDILRQRRLPDQTLSRRWQNTYERALEVYQNYKAKELEYIRGIIKLLNPVQQRILHIDPCGNGITLPWNGMREALTMDHQMLRRQGAETLKNILAGFLTAEGIPLNDLHGTVLKAITRARRSRESHRISRAFYEIAAEMEFPSIQERVEATALRIFSSPFMAGVLKEHAAIAAADASVTAEKNHLQQLTMEQALSMMKSIDAPAPDINDLLMLKNYEIINLMSLDEKTYDAISRLTGIWLNEASDTAASIEQLALDGPALELSRFLLINNSPDMGSSLAASKQFKPLDNILQAFYAKNKETASLLGTAIDSERLSLVRSAVRSTSTFLPYSLLRSFMEMSTLQFRRKKVDLAGQIIREVSLAANDEDTSNNDSAELSGIGNSKTKRSVIMHLEESYERLQIHGERTDNIIYELMKNIVLSIPELSRRTPLTDSIEKLLLQSKTLNFLGNVRLEHHSSEK